MLVSSLRSISICSNGASNGLNNCLEVVLERGTANEEAIDVWLLHEVSTVACVHGSTVQNSRFTCNVIGDILGKPLSNLKVSVLCLLWRGDLTSSDGPDGLVGDDDVAPLGLLKLISNCLKLSGVDLAGLASFSLLELLADACHDGDTIINSGLGLLGDVLV